MVFDRIETEENWFSSSPREGKCRFSKIVPKKGHWEILDLRDVTLPEEVTIYNVARSLEGKRYDYFGIIFWYVFFFVKRQHDNKWWCSEVVGYLLGHKDFRITPNELAKYYYVPRSEFKIHLGQTPILKK